MSAIGNNTETNILALLFNATTWADIAENDTTSPHTNIHVALATADYTDTGTMSSNEATYTGYARVNVARTVGGWTVAGTAPTKVNPAAAITFIVGSAGSGTVTHFAAGKTGGGAVDTYFYGVVTPNIVTGSGVTPQLTTATQIELA